MSKIITNNRVVNSYIMFFQGLQTQERYLFLFSDLLLVAKQK